MTKKVILNAYPRITMGLKVFDVNENTKKMVFDGLFLLVDEIHDELHIQKADKFSVEYFDRDNNVLKVHDDLLTQAASFLERFFSIKVNVSIKVKKNVPLGSGLAGMASCAAALIKFYADTYNLPVSFYSIASQLNENIPFFLTGFKLARVQNIGDQINGLTNVKLPKFKLHLSSLPVSKTLVLEKFLAQNKYLPNNTVSQLVDDLTNNRPFSLANDLQNAIFNIRQDLMFASAQLKTRFNQVVFSGYGSTLVELEDPFFSPERKN